MPIAKRVPLTFTPTQHSTADDKLKFYNHFTRFVEKDFPSSLFTKDFYQRLSMCFGHIAHYDANGFYGTWFTSDGRKFKFVNNVLRWPCHGQPDYTYCDVEKALQQWVAQNAFHAKYLELATRETERRERAELSRLQAKYAG